MLGFGSAEMAWVFWLCIAASALCLIYGIVKWNDSGIVDTVLEEDEDEGGQTS